MFLTFFCKSCSSPIAGSTTANTEPQQATAAEARTCCAKPNVCRLLQCWGSSHQHTPHLWLGCRRLGCLVSQLRQCLLCLLHQFLQALDLGLHTCHSFCEDEQYWPHTAVHTDRTMHYRHSPETCLHGAQLDACLHARCDSC